MKIETIVGEVIKHVPGDHVGIHADNDTSKQSPIRSPRRAPARVRFWARSMVSASVAATPICAR